MTTRFFGFTLEKKNGFGNEACGCRILCRILCDTVFHQPRCNRLYHLFFTFCISEDNWASVTIQTKRFEVIDNCLNGKKIAMKFVSAIAEYDRYIWFEYESLQAWDFLYFFFFSNSVSEIFHSFFFVRVFDIKITGAKCTRIFINICFRYELQFFLYWLFALP